MLNYCGPMIPSPISWLFAIYQISRAMIILLNAMIKFNVKLLWSYEIDFSLNDSQSDILAFCHLSNVFIMKWMLSSRDYRLRIVHSMYFCLPQFIISNQV